MISSELTLRSVTYIKATTKQCYAGPAQPVSSGLLKLKPELLTVRATAKLNLIKF